MVSQWVPPDISQVCAQTNATLPQCSPTGFLYLTLLAQLYGRSVDEKPYLKSNPYDDVPYSDDASVETFPPDQTSESLESTDSESERRFITKPIKNIILQNVKPNICVPNNKKRENKRRVPDEYDFIIIGAGSAGCVMANRLSEFINWKILLLEAGPEEPEVTSVPAVVPALARSSIDWGYRSQPDELTCQSMKGKSCAWIRGKTMGGSSALNFMVYMRGNKADYDGWAAAGNPGWSYKEVLPYFKKAENNRNLEVYDKKYHSEGGPLNVERYPYIDKNVHLLVQAFKEKGLPVRDFNAESQLGTDIAQSTSRYGQRFSVNSAYIRPIRNKRRNLKIVTDAFVTKIIIDVTTKTAIGVEYVKQGVKLTAYASKEVISSAGAINSPKLLMLSGIGPVEHLEKHNITVLSNLAVGRNLQDHVTTNAMILSLSNKTATSVDGPELLNQVHDYYRQPPHKNGPLASTGTLSAVAFIKTKLSKDGLPDIQFHFDGRNVQELYADPPSSLASRILPLAFYNGLSVKPLLLVPKSKGFIMLNQTDPVFGPPLIHPKFFTEKNDMDVLIAGLKFATSLENTPTFINNGAYFLKVPIPGCENFKWGTNDYFRCILTQYTATICHPACTCKMGPKSDTEAVVDAKLRVHGINRLRVVDCSIMPQIVRGNLNAPAIMIAEKAADMIKETYCQ